MDNRANVAREFERESHRIDQDIWDAMALRAGETVLFCGFANDVDWIKRAADVGVLVSVIATDDAEIVAFREIGITVLKGSTTLIPARDASFDAAVAFHYLHEIDPFFHANVVSELARVGKRLIVVEPAPPTDPLGLRIATLYSRAKRELGQFEYYQHVDYWKKLVSIAKPEVAQQVFSFNRVPPRDAIKETVALILDTMAAEATPEPYLAELRTLAKRPDAQLVPQSRYVLVGAPAGKVPAMGAGTRFREAPEPAPAPVRAVPPARPTVYATPVAVEMPPIVPSRPEGEPGFGFDPQAVPRETWQGASAAHINFSPAPAAGPPPGVPDSSPPFGMPFATPSEEPAPFGLGSQGAHDDPLPKTGFGWEWEPPEDPNAAEKPPEGA